MWSSWAGNQHMEPAQLLHPSSTDEVVLAVTQAASTGQRVKAIGSGHSFTGIGLTDGVLLQLDRLTGIRRVDPVTHRVTVAAGMPLHRLNAELAAHGLGLTNMGDIDRQTISGSIATGTHGTGRDSGALATQVVGLELVLADGTVMQCSKDENPDVFSAARVSLGALGIVTSVTLQAEPAFRLRADERPMPLDDVLDGFHELVAANEHFELYWFPHTEIALTKRNNRADEVEPLSRGRALFEDEVLSNGLFGLTCRLSKAIPRAIPTLNKASAKALSARSYADAAPSVFTSPRRVRFCEMEYALPREAVVPALRELRGLPERLGLRISFPVEVRVAPADDISLSTAAGRDTAYVAVHQFRGVDPTAYFAAVEAVMTGADGRPHWGKLHTQDAAILALRYPRFAAFTALRDRLDPDRRFANAYLNRVLG